jgi:hypothetical protein
MPQTLYYMVSLIEASRIHERDTSSRSKCGQGYYNRAIQTLANEEQVRMRNDEFRNGELRTMHERTIKHGNYISNMQIALNKRFLVGTHDFTAMVQVILLRSL